MIFRLFVMLFVISSVMFIGDAYGQSIPQGDYPFEKKLVGIKFLDAYFGTMDEKLEVNPGDSNVPLTVVLSNIGTNDIVGIKGQLSLSTGLSDSRSNGMLAKADSETTASAGDIFSLTFFVDVSKNAKIMTYPATVKVDYSRIREAGARSDFFPFEFDLTGRSVINMKALDPILTSLTVNKVTMEITNDGTAPISGVTVKLNNAMAENSNSQSITNVEKVVVFESDWDIGDLQPKSSKYIDVDVLIPDSLKGEALRAPIEITYFNAHGEKSTTTKMVDFYVNGLIDISTNGIKSIKISGKDYIVGDIVNEGNEDGLFGYVTVKPINNSNLQEVTNFIDEIEVDSPVPFNIPVAFVGDPRYGEHDLEITIRYKDSMREEYFVTKQATVFIEKPPVIEEDDNSAITYMLSILGIGLGVFVLNKKGYIPINKKKKVKTSG